MLCVTSHAFLSDMWSPYSTSLQKYYMNVYYRYYLKFFLINLSMFH